MRIEHPVAINYGNDLLIRLELIPSKIFGSILTHVIISLPLNICQSNPSLDSIALYLGFTVVLAFTVDPFFARQNIGYSIDTFDHISPATKDLNSSKPA